jgi:hypothetical protein
VLVADGLIFNRDDVLVGALIAGTFESGGAVPTAQRDTGEACTL